MESSREKIMGSEGIFMGDEISEHSITFCWEDACQQHTVQNIMGSRGWKKSKDRLSSRKNYGYSTNWTHDFKVKDQHLSH